MPQNRVDSKPEQIPWIGARIYKQKVLSVTWLLLGYVWFSNFENHRTFRAIHSKFSHPWMTHFVNWHFNREINEFDNLTKHRRKKFDSPFLKPWQFLRQAKMGVGFYTKTGSHRIYFGRWFGRLAVPRIPVDDVCPSVCPPPFRFITPTDRHKRTYFKRKPTEQEGKTILITKRGYAIGRFPKDRIPFVQYPSKRINRFDF